MISALDIRGFKSIEHAHLVFGGLNLFVGTNAAGKSNLFDALRVLQGIGYGFTVEEILNGKPKSATSEVWEGIRGGSTRVAYVPRGAGGPDPEAVVEFALSAELAGRLMRYRVAISPALGCVRSESLDVQGRDVFSSASISNDPRNPDFTVRYYRGSTGRQPHLKFERSRPVLSQLAKHGQCQKRDAEAVTALLRALSNTQRLDPSPAVLREYSKAQQVPRMGERGENFAALIAAICTDPDRREAYTEWLRQLTPMEVDDVHVLSGALGEPLFAVRESGHDSPAPILSDGTLRFAAIAAAFFQPDMPGVLTIEEIENGVHPSRLRLLVELLRSQSQRNAVQVMATTHSPIVLAWLAEKDYATTFFCSRDEGTGASRLTPLRDVPNFTRLVKRQPIGELFAEGWLEGAL